MSSVFPSGMQAVAENPVLGVFTAIEIALPETTSLPATTLQMLDGSGVISWGGSTFVGQDGDYGSWAGVSEPIEDAIAVQSPRFKTTFHGLSQTAIQQLCQPESQGAPVTLYFGFFNTATGEPVTDPVTWFMGVIDNGTLTISDNMKSVDLNIVAMTEFMFLNNEGAKLNSAWHQLFFPAENGFAFVDNVDHQIPWGVQGPRPDQVTDVRNFDTTLAPQATTLKF